MMAAIATDGKGNYLTLNASGDWVPTDAPAMKETGTAPEVVGDTVVSPDDMARINAPPANPPISSLSDLRDRIQQGDISTLKSLAPGSDAGPIESGARYAAMIGVHGLATLAQMPINALMGLAQGPSGAVTINPATNTLGLTPEAMTTAQVLTPGGGVVGGRDVQFSGANAFKRDAPSTLEQAGVMKRAPVTLEELNAAINRATTTQNQLMPGETPPPSGPAPQASSGVSGDFQITDPTSGKSLGGGSFGGTSPQPEPAPAGAQTTPPGQAALTPEQAAAAGSTADKQWYYKTIIPGEANNIQYIDGITPTMAQSELTTNAARESKLLRRISEDADQNERALLGRHSEIRKNEFQNIAGNDTTSQTAMKAANDQIEQQLGDAYAHGGTVDLQAVIDATNRELSSSAGKLPPMKAAMKAIQDAAQKDDGSGLETDPRQANAVRRAIIYMQSKVGQSENIGYADPSVMAALTRVKDVLTKQVEPVAPGFTEANANYAKARQALDAREALQEYEPKLYTGPLGNMTFGPMHRLMGDVIAGRDPAAPMNPYKALTEEQMNRLKSLHDDLQRVASAEELARAAGSDTSPTLFDMAKRAAKSGMSTLGGAAVGGVVGQIYPPAAIPAAMFTKTALDNLFSQRAVAQATAEHGRLLQPDLTVRPLKPNPLMQPPEAP
jgi:hypothetical protein